MNENPNYLKTKFETLFLKSSIFIFWWIAFVVWWSLLWHAQAYARFGAELPSASKLVVSSVHLGFPFMLAAVLSAVVMYQWFRPRQCSALIAGWMLCIAIIYASFAMLAITLPIVTLCGEFVPTLEGDFQSKT